MCEHLKMNFSKVLSKEIRKRKKTDKNGDNSSVKAQKLERNNDRNPERKLAEKTPETEIADSKVVNSQKSQSETPIVPSETPKNAMEQSKNTDDVTSEALKQELTEFDAFDPNMPIAQQKTLLQSLKAKRDKYERYRIQKEKESTADTTFKLEEVTNVSCKPKLEVQLRVFVKSLVKQWEQACGDDDQQQKLLFETKKDLVLLLYKLRSNQLTDDMVTSLGTICYYIQNNEFLKANESYMKLSIGNIAWPIGVLDVGIHARSADLKITGEKSGANIMIDDKTRRWITAIKRLITFKEKRFNSKST